MEAARHPLRPAPERGSIASPAPAADHKRRLASVGWPAAVAVVLVSGALRAWLGLDVAAPWIAPDEPLYGLLGRSLAGDETPLAIGVTDTAFLAPLLLRVSLLVFQDLAHAVALVQVVQAFAMSAAGAIVYAWVKPLGGPRWALVATLLTVAIPGLAYSGLLMTEATFYVTATLALLALARVLEQPTLARQAQFLAACSLAVSARLQGLALLPAAVLAVAVVATMERSTRVLRALWPILAGCLACGVALSAALIAGIDALGVYTGSVLEDYAPSAVAADVARHLGAVALVVGGIPLVALALLATAGLRLSRGIQALVAVAIAWTAVVAIQVGLFASRFVGHLAERDLLTVAPPLFAVFAVWLALGMPRRAPWSYLAGLAVAAPAVWLPVGTLATIEARLDSFSTIAFQQLAAGASASTATVAWSSWMAAVALVAILARARWRLLPPVLVLCTLVPLSVVSALEVRTASQEDERWWFGTSSPRWIDENATAPVTYLYAGGQSWGAVWKHAFWNRRLLAVATVGPERVPGTMLQTPVGPRFDGRLFRADGATLEAPYVVSPLGMAVAGSQVASIGPSGTLPGLVLWRTSGSVRLRHWVRGLAPDGLLTPETGATVTGWDCLGATLTVRLVGLDDAVVRIGALNWREQAVRLRRGNVRDVALPAPPGAARCEYALATNAPVTIAGLDFRRPGGVR